MENEQEAGLRIIRRPDWIDIVLDRPEMGNRITNEMGAAIAQALHTIGPDIKLVRLRAEGDTFCAGRESPSIDRAKARATEFKQQIADPPLALYQAFKDAPAPVLGIVQGEAVGVGCALAALCDVAIGAEDSHFRLPELGHGIPPTLVMSALAGRVPYQAIARLVLTGESVSATQAQAWGILAKTVPAADLQSQAEAATDLLLQRPAPAMQAVKEYLRFAVAAPQNNASSLAANLISTVLSSKH